MLRRMLLHYSTEFKTVTLLSVATTHSSPDSSAGKRKKKKVPETVMLLTSRIIWIHSEGEKCDTMMKDKSLMVLFLS